MLTERDVRALLTTDGPVDRMFLNDEFDVWAVGDGLVAKFPRTEIDAAKVPVEAALHPTIRGVLGDVVPAIRVVGTMSDGGRRFIVYERATGVQGQTIDGASAGAADGLAEDIGRLFGALHEVGAQDAYGLGAGTRTISYEMQPLRDATVDRATEIAGDAIGRFLSRPAPAASDRRTLCHTDIKGEHVFVDEGRRRVTAIIDWADAEVCDPAEDYAGLVIWLGPALTRACVEASGEDDATLADRAIWLGRVGILEYWDDVLAGVEHAPISLITEQVRIAFSA
jgi:aminoglycoside phosphotransferase (APT) family kinase protein